MNRALFLLWVGLVLCVNVASAQEQPAQPNRRSSPQPQNVIAKFAVARQGDLLRIPVEIGGSEYEFLLDTGAMANVLDKSLAEKLGPLKRSRRSYPQGVPPLYQLPVAKLGGTDIAVTGDTALVDLAELRRMSGYDIQGLLGINFLQTFVLELDFDNGSVSFLEAAPQRKAKPFHLSRDPHDRRMLLIDILPDRSVPFLVDTGMASPGVGELTSAVFDELLEANRLTLLGPEAKTLTLAGVVSNRKAQVDVFKLAGFEHRNLRVSAGTLNGLGLRFLSRYKVTLDFVNDQAWFEPGQRFSAPAMFDSSGMIFSRTDGQTIVERVHPDGPAFAAGIKAGDVLTHLNGHPLSEHTLFTIRQVLCRPERTLKFTLERSGESHVCELTLKNWQKAVLE